LGYRPFLCSSFLCVEVLTQRFRATHPAFYRSAADDEFTNDWNHDSFNKIRFRPRIFRDIREADTSTTLLGHRSTLPFFIAPAAMAKLAHPDGELALCRAAGKAGIIQGVCSCSTTHSFLSLSTLLTVGFLFSSFVSRVRQLRTRMKMSQRQGFRVKFCFIKYVSERFSLARRGGKNPDQVNS
jgi:isopentenyl diphosphate isomerase/L-lactate dehydrogenase-like FMN-dependent dehydrogenase